MNKNSHEHVDYPTLRQFKALQDEVAELRKALAACVSRGELDALLTASGAGRHENTPRLTDGHEHARGLSLHYGWMGHDGHPVHRHDGKGRTEWEKP